MSTDPTQTTGGSATILADDTLVAAGRTGGPALPVAEESGAANSTIKTVSSGVAGSFPIETTMPDKEVRHNISDGELEMLHRGHADDRVSDKAFDVFLAACGAAAGAAPQVVKDIWSAFLAKTTVSHDVFGVVALLVFGGAIATAFAMRLFWKKEETLSAVDRKVAEIRDRTNRTRHFVAQTDTANRP